MRTRIFSEWLILVTLLMLMTTCGNRSEPAGSTGSPVLLTHAARIRSLSAWGPNHASLLVGREGEPGSLKATTDGGRTWQSMGTQQSGVDLHCINVTNRASGWAVDLNGQVFTTNSGGETWIKITDPQVSASSGESLKGATHIEFVNETDGWLLGMLTIWRSDDAGLSWREVLSPLTPGVKGQPTSIYPIDRSTLVSSGTGGQVYLTRDGGETWKIETLVNDGDFTDVSFTDKENGWLTGYVGGGGFRPILFKTNDGGESWKESLIPDQAFLPKSVYFIGNWGWLAGRRRLNNYLPPNSFEGVLLHTVDAGVNWTEVPIDGNDPFFNIIQFTDLNYGWLAGRDNLYRTEDGGATWSRVLSLPPVVSVVPTSVIFTPITAVISSSVETATQDLLWGALFAFSYTTRDKKSAIALRSRFDGFRRLFSQ